MFLLTNFSTIISQQIVFCPTFISQVIVVTKGHCSNCSSYQPTNSNRGGTIVDKIGMKVPK